MVTPRTSRVVVLLACITLGPIATLLFVERQSLARLWPLHSRDLPVVHTVDDLRRVRPLELPALGAVRFGVDAAHPESASSTVFALLPPARDERLRHSGLLVSSGGRWGRVLVLPEDPPSRGERLLAVSVLLEGPGPHSLEILESGGGLPIARRRVFAPGVAWEELLDWGSPWSPVTVRRSDAEELQLPPEDAGPRKLHSLPRVSR